MESARSTPARTEFNRLFTPEYSNRHASGLNLAHALVRAGDLAPYDEYNWLRLIVMDGTGAATTATGNNIVP